jgi:hypothetical protein
MKNISIRFANLILGHCRTLKMRMAPIFAPERRISGSLSCLSPGLGEYLLGCIVSHPKQIVRGKQANGGEPVITLSPFAEPGRQQRYSYETPPYCHVQSHCRRRCVGIGAVVKALIIYAFSIIASHAAGRYTKPD